MASTVAATESPTRRRWALAATALLVALSLGACETAGQGAVTGGAVGALSGLAIGSLTGSAGTGAAIGAITGVVGGAIIGDQNRRRNEEAMRSSGTPPPPPDSAPAYEAVQALDGLVGRWSVAGWCQSAEGGRVDVHGEATGTADKNFFVRIDLHVTDPRTGEVIEGTSVISQNGGRRITMVNTFSTSPVVKTFEGDLDATGSIFTLHQVSPKADRRVILRRSGSGWVAEGWDHGQRTESLTLTAM